MLGKKTKEEPVAVTPDRAGGSPSREQSVITKDLRIAGDCETEGLLRIEGTVTGSVRARGLEVTESGKVAGDLEAPEGGTHRTFIVAGRVEGAVRAAQVEVRPSGVVLGGIVADEARVQGRVEEGVIARQRLELAETAVVEGDVRAVRLALKEGGQVNGTILMGERAAIDTVGSSRSGKPAGTGTDEKKGSEKDASAAAVTAKDSENGITVPLGEESSGARPAATG